MSRDTFLSTWKLTPAEYVSRLSFASRKVADVGDKAPAAKVAEPQKAAESDSGKTEPVGE